MTQRDLRKTLHLLSQASPKVYSRHGLVRLWIVGIGIAIGTGCSSQPLSVAPRPLRRLPADYELVYSYPAETSLVEPDLRQASEVWPEMFESARASIDICAFYLSPSASESIEASLKALERAGRTGVRIRVLFEKKMERDSQDGIKRLRSIPNLELRALEWSTLSKQGILHAKYFILDSTRAFVGSQNFDWRSLAHVHELGLAVADPAIVSPLKSIFESDWKAAESKAPGPPVRAERLHPDRSGRGYLVASPWRLNPPGVGDSEDELVRLIGEAKKELLVQLLDFTPLSYPDPSASEPRRFYPVIDNALRDAAVRGVRVKLLVSHWNTEQPAIQHLKSLAVLDGIDVRVVTIPESGKGPIKFARVAHSKYMVVDGRTLWLGTSNWSGSYLDFSRNVEVVVKDEALAERVARIHAHLWGSDYSEPLLLQKCYPPPRR